IVDRRGRVKLPEGVENTLALHDCETGGEVLAELYRRGVTSVLVEGGSEVLQSFIDSGHWDAARVERGSKPIDGSVRAPRLKDARVTECREIDGNIITRYEREVHYPTGEA
ncbi:MAG: dihydrofolate reductase family protein, partial [Duncaniella sp.]|nr:dihydrofolate reductase family protein [Duncaniella sp.]